MMGNKHDASGQMGGYLYQTLIALWLLIKAENPDAQLSIEKFDDIAFLEKDTPFTMIQTKHQMFKRGNLGDSSNDLWRTLKSWIDYVKQDVGVVENTKFVILTTAQVGEGSIAYLLGEKNRETQKALESLQTVASANLQISNNEYYQEFLSLTEELRAKLVENIYIISSAPHIGDIKKEIMPFVRMATISKHEDSVYNSLLGWWISEIIEGLQSKEIKTITYKHLRSVINDKGSEYKAESLPINVDINYQPNEQELSELSGEERIFIEQLRLIALSDDKIRRCIKDYYNAYKQRSQWVREQVIYTEDLTKYEERLKREWERLFDDMSEDLKDYGAYLTEEKKIEKGKQVYRKIEGLDIRIKNVEDPFMMRGTYHGLANDLKIGWHIDFYKKLHHLLRGGQHGKVE